MKKNKLLTLAAAAMMATGAWAQTDVTSTYLTNADFSSQEGWTQTHSNEYWALNNGFIGTLAIANNKVSTTDDTHLAIEYCLGIQCRWSTNYAAFTQTTSELPVGVYTLTYDVQNANTSNNVTYANLFTVTVGGTTYTDSKTEWMNGKSNWTTHSITFNVTEAAAATISLGYGTGSNNIGSGSTPHLYVSHLNLTWTDPLEAKKADLQDAIDAATGFNESLANSTLAAAIETAVNAKASATTEDALNSAIATLNAAVVAAVGETNDETNVTTALFVVNNSFETGDLSGWKANSANDTGVKKNEAGTYYTENGDGSYLFNTWGGSAAKYVQQTVTNLPEGYYTVTALVASDAGNKVTLYAGSIQTEVEASADGKEYFVEGSTSKVYVEANGSLEIGATSTAWYKVDNFRLTHYTVAAGAKEALDEAIAEAKRIDVITNVGTGIFQKPVAAVTTFNSAIEAAEAVYNNGTATAEDYKKADEDLAAAIEAWKNTELNAPAADKQYNLVVSTTGHAKEGNSVIIIPGATSANNPTGYALNANFASNVNLNQAVTFTQVSGNLYNISFETADGTTYLTYGTNNSSAAGWSDWQIQATTDAEKKGEFKIAVSKIANAFIIYNTIKDETINCQDGGNIYTDGLTDFSLVEVGKPSIAINTTAAGWGTVMLPFAQALPEGVKAYSVRELKADQRELIIDEVNALEANKPYIIEGVWNATLTGDAQGTALTITEGLLTGTYADHQTTGGEYVLQNQDKIGFYQVGSEEGDAKPWVRANHAYLTAPAAAVKAFFLGENTTSVNAVKVAADKAAVYNLAGQRVNKAQKGIYIVNGQKVVK